MSSTHRRIEIWRYTQTGTNQYNEAVYSWSRIRVLAARVRDLRGAERFEASQVFALREMTFRTRWFADLQPTDIIIFDGRQFDISGIAEIGRRHGYELTATWRQNDEEALS